MNLILKSANSCSWPSMACSRSEKCRLFEGMGPVESLVPRLEEHGQGLGEVQRGLSSHSEVHQLRGRLVEEVSGFSFLKNCPCSLDLLQGRRRNIVLGNVHVLLLLWPWRGGMRSRPCLSQPHRYLNRCASLWDPVRCSYPSGSGTWRRLEIRVP